MVMRVGGLASGMDIEAMVNKLMEAERIPLTKLQQQQTTLTWKTEAFRDINSKLLDLDKMMINMKLSTTYKPKEAVSSQEGAVTATASSSAANGSYNINVTQLASNEMWTSENDNIEVSTPGTYTFQTYDEKKKEFTTKEIQLTAEDNLKSVLKKINDSSEGTVRAFYDEGSKQIIMETTRTGKYNDEGTEIVFDSRLQELLGFDGTPAKGATDAVFKYNDGVELTSKNNSYTLNGISFNFNSTTDGNARISITNNVDEAFDNIKEFVDKYNEMIDAMNKSQTEEKYRDFPPLTKEQEAEMSDKQIEQWEKKAKSGILRGETMIRDGMTSLRSSLQGVVDTDGQYNMLSQIGITTTKNYLDGGKLEIDEEKLKAALRDNSDDVYKLFSSNSEGASRGLMHRFDDALDKTKGQIEQKAGNSASVSLENYSIGKQMKELNKRIGVFEKRMIQVEQRYWNQFNAMEKAISKLNQQADYLFSQFGGGM